MQFPSPFSKKGISVVIETPRGSRNKFKYEPEGSLLKLSKTLPQGTAFRLDFGFVPHTEGPDGDPLDVLVMMEEPTYPGCLVECRIVGVIQAMQKEKKEDPVRNDRIIAVSVESILYSNVYKLKDVNPELLKDVEHFFEYYNEMEGRK